MTITIQSIQLIKSSIQSINFLYCIIVIMYEGIFVELFTA